MTSIWKRQLCLARHVSALQGSLAVLSAFAWLYLVVAGTDSDDDGLICDDGEACGAWPTIGVPTPITVDGADVAGLDFLAGFEISLGAAAAQAGPAAWPSEGFRRLAPLKALEVKP